MDSSDDEINPDAITVHVPAALDIDSDDDGDGKILAPLSKGSGIGVAAKTGRNSLLGSSVQNKATEKKKKSSTDSARFVEQLLKEKERKAKVREVAAQAAESSASDNEESQESISEYTECAQQLKQEADLSDYGSDDEDGVGLFYPVPPFAPPKVPEEVHASFPWLSEKLEDVEGLKVWLKNQQVESRMLSSGDLCHFVLLLFHPRQDISREAVRALSRLLSFENNTWRPKQQDLINALCDYGMDPSAVPEALQARAGLRQDEVEGRRRLGVYATPCAVQMMYDTWCDGQLVEYDEATALYTFEAAEDGDRQTLSGFPDVDVRIPPAKQESSCSEDVFHGHRAVNAHAVSFFWTLQACFQHRWVLLCKLRSDPNIRDAPSEALRGLVAWPGAGACPAAALESCMRLLLQGVAASAWTPSFQARLASTLSGSAVTASDKVRLDLSNALPATPRGMQLRRLVCSSMLRRLTKPGAVSGEGEGEGEGEGAGEGRGDVGPRELASMLLAVGVSGPAPLRVSVGSGLASSVEALSSILAYAFETLQDYEISDCKDEELKRLLQALEHAQRWQKLLTSSSTARAILDMSETLSLLENSVKRMIKRHQDLRKPAVAPNPPKQDMRSFFARKQATPDVQAAPCSHAKPQPVKRKHDFGGDAENVHPNVKVQRAPNCMPFPV